MITSQPALFLIFSVAFWLVSLWALTLCTRFGWQGIDTTRSYLAGLVTGYALAVLGFNGASSAGAIWLAACGGYSSWMLAGFLLWAYRSGRVA